MIAVVSTLWRERPLALILILGGFFRLLAVFLSNGYAMHDDHFHVVEVAQGWVDGRDLFDWLSQTYGGSTSFRSLVYPGLVFLLFEGLEALGLDDPMEKMGVLRLLHALWSMLAIVFVYRIAEVMGHHRAARQAALLTAVLWLMPYISVRTLSEVACIPLLLAGAWLVLKYRTMREAWLALLLAGLCFGLAFSIRYQSILFGAGMGLGLLLDRQVRPALWLLLGTLLPIGLIHGLLEGWITGDPFGKVIYYIQYNATHSDEYIVLPWYNYLLLLVGILGPIGPLYFFGIFWKFRPYLPLFLGFMLFLAFHSYIPNKQERFLFTVLPAYFLLGSLGWNQFVQHARFWTNNPGIQRGLWIAFWAINGLALLAFSTYFPKEALVRAMYSLGQGSDPVHSLLVDDVRRPDTLFVPRYYSGQWPVVYVHTQKYDLAYLQRCFEALPADRQPEVVLFIGNEQLDERVEDVRQLFPGLQFARHFEANALDRFLHWLNEYNRTEEVYKYRVPE